jgi:hypothetical protein
LSFTSPKTWASGYVVLASDLNTYIRDNQNMTAPAIMSAQGDILIASGANTPIRLAKSTTSTQYLANTGSSNAPAWNEVALDTGISGTLPVGNGGTGQTSLTTGAILIGNATSGVTMLTQTTKGQILIGDGSGPPQMLAVGSNDEVLTAASGETTGVKWAAGGAGAVVREGGNTTEATTTSSTAADLLTASSLTLQAAEHAFIIYNGRKTSGAGADGGCGLKLNSTIVGEAAESESGRGWVSDGTNEAQSGSCFICLGSRVTNYLSGYVGLFSRGQGTQIAQASMPLDELSITAAFPNAEITDVIIRINGGASGPTWGADELQVYSFAAS